MGRLRGAFDGISQHPFLLKNSDRYIILSTEPSLGFETLPIKSKVPYAY